MGPMEGIAYNICSTTFGPESEYNGLTSVAGDEKTKQNKTKQKQKNKNKNKAKKKKKKDTNNKQKQTNKKRFHLEMGKYLGS